MPKSSQPRKTWRYSSEFKAKAVQLSLMTGVQVKAVAETLDIHPFMLSRWRKEYREGKIMADKRKKIVSLAKDKVELDKIKSLQKEVAKLKQENELLKKWQRFLAELRHALNSYINRFYNHQRIHSGIGYTNPANFERVVA